jgi:hypothetical protein
MKILLIAATAASALILAATAAAAGGFSLVLFSGQNDEPVAAKGLEYTPRLCDGDVLFFPSIDGKTLTVTLHSPYREFGALLTLFDPRGQIIASAKSQWEKTRHGKWYSASKQIRLTRTGRYTIRFGGLYTIDDVGDQLDCNIVMQQFLVRGA